MNPEEKVVEALKAGGVDFICSLPCDRIKCLYPLISQQFFHLPLTREEEGVGITAGAALAGKNPAMLIQSSGVGNMINALASLTMFYRLPLFLLISWRGVYEESIEAQRPMGRHVPDLLKTLGIGVEEMSDPEDIDKIEETASRAFRKGRVFAALLSPKLWKESSLQLPKIEIGDREIVGRTFEGERVRAISTRYEIIKGLKDELSGKVVVSNLGVPSKELYQILHQPSNFYMLGSMGMASPIGLGISIASYKEVIVIDGDGSLLMNPGVLATVAEMNPKNLSILAIDNGVHGSTGNQPTAASNCVNLAMLAEGMGIKNTMSTGDINGLSEALQSGEGPRFIHALALPGNAKVSDIPLPPKQIKSDFMEFLRR